MTTKSFAMQKVYTVPVFIFLTILLSAYGVPCVIAQQGEPDPDGSTESGNEWGEDWTLDSLNIEDFDFQGDDVYRYSKGWFPTPYEAASLSFFSGINNDLHDRATNLRSRAFEPTVSPFDWHDPYNCSGVGEFFGFDCKEKQILKDDSDEPVEGGYPRRNYSEIGLRFLYHLPVPAILRAEAAYRVSNGLLYSEDTTRAYLPHDGVPRSFREIGVLFHHQDIVSGGIGLQIPVNGVFFDSDFGSIGSYYYIFGQLAADYALFVRTRQYTQIADAKDQIRFGNGQDTVSLMNTNAPEGINRLRTSWEAGLGWGLSFEVFVAGIEAYISVPFTSLVDDGNWKQYYAGLRFSLGYQWGTTSRLF